VILNAESNKLTIIVMFVTDAILLMTMFVGLLRLRRRGGGTFELGRLLWKQVRWWLFSLAISDPDTFFISRGCYLVLDWHRRKAHASGEFSWFSRNRICAHGRSLPRCSCLYACT
jgi:hypothetical protein